MSNEIKVALKKAHELLKQKEYADVMNICKTILKEDRANYMALILLAAAMRQTEKCKSQVPLVLEKAVDIEPNNPLAWQGLVTYYEKDLQDDDNWGKQALAYCKLLQLDGDPSKFLYNLNKVWELSLRLEDKEMLNQVIEGLSSLRESSDIDKIKLINKILSDILTHRPSNAVGHEDLFESIIVSVIQDFNVVGRQDYYRKYLKVLYSRGKLEDLVREAIEMYRQFPQDVYPLEYVCRIYYEQSVLEGRCLDIEIAEFCEPLLELNAQSKAGIIAKAVQLKNTDDLINAREILNDLIQSKTQSFYVWMILSDIYMSLNCWDDAENAIRHGFRLAKGRVSEEVLGRIEVTMIECMGKSSSTEKWKAALEMCRSLLKEQSSIRLQLIHARTSVLLDDPNVCAELTKLESQNESRVQANILQALYLKNHNRLEEAVNILDPDSEASEAWLLLGEIYWKMAQYNYSLIAFLNCMKVDRYSWQCLVYLGRYYRERGNDLERSRRCYQTAIQINPNSEEAGIGLSTVFRLLKNQDANMQLLRRLTMQDSGPKWAWLQLGLQYLDQGDAMQAIKALQHVVRAGPNDTHSWRCLADAYLMRGSYTSALRSYERALELSPGSLYTMIQLSNIKLAIGEHKEAKEDFERILLNDPHYVPGLKGLAEACLGLGNENTTSQLLGRARENFQQAIDSLTIAAAERNDLCCIWKLLGDACYKTATLPEKYSYLNVIPALMKSESSEKQITIRQRDIYLLSTRCYCRALSLSQESALLWHDLACCYYMQLQFASSNEQKKIANKCLAITKHAVKLSPDSWLHWNLLGVLCMSPFIKNYALAQHSYVMAIDKESNNAIIWSNLGTLYMHIGDMYKANEAYSHAQRLVPAYINSWIGQALIAENTRRNEAMDLFRHSTQLGYHGQASIGYAHWVLTVLLDPYATKDYMYTYIIENMHAVVVATDVLNWYIEHNPRDSYARNSCGLLLERQRMYRSAAEQFAAALHVCEHGEKDYISVNLARVLMQLGKYSEAVDLCRSVKKGSFSSQCQLAISLFKAERYEESYSAYETALRWFAETESEKASILCAMAAMAYMFQGVDDVKTLLFQCIQMQPPVVNGFLAAAALGVLYGDLNLTTLVLEELKPYKDNPEYGHHVANLSAYWYLVRDDNTNAITLLSKAVHRHPHDIRYWVPLLRILLSTDLQTFGRCAKKVLLLSRSIRNIDIVNIACATSFGYFTQGLVQEGIRSAQKILFTYPGHVESWSTLVASLISRCANGTAEPDAQWISKLISIIVNNFCTTKEMLKWLHSAKRKIDKMQ